VSGLPLPLPDPALRDGDLLLRPWSGADAAALALAWADPEIARWTGVPPRHDEVAARRWIDGDADRRARGLSLDLVVERAGEVVGEVGLSDIDTAARRAEIGWWVGAGHRGQGIATRAAGLVAAWAVAELDLEVVVARCHRQNPASGAVARRAGFRPVGEDGPAQVWAFAAEAGATLGA
jgi:RimJ/RimL family protein N-acetyltransferase